jgi:hypothetical protein
MCFGEKQHYKKFGDTMNQNLGSSHSKHSAHSEDDQSFSMLNALNTLNARSKEFVL